MNSNKQSGFSAVIGVVAIIIVIGVLGLIGWRLYNQPKTMKTANATPTTTNSPANPTSTTSTTKATITPQGTYLDIKELGIKILLNSQINDAIYSIVPTTDGSKGAGISAQSLVNLSAACSTSHYTLGLIEATTTAPTNVNGQTATPDNKSLFKINNTYYWYRPPQNEACVTSGDQTTANAIGNKLSAFEQAFTTAQSDN